jgi:hypothetical protein
VDITTGVTVDVTRKTARSRAPQAFDIQHAFLEGFVIANSSHAIEQAASGS